MNSAELTLSPILMQGSISISPGEKIELPYGTISNPFRTAMLVDEIRFSFDDNNPGANVNSLQIQAEMFVGRIPLTNGPVPIRSFGRTLNIYDALVTVTDSNSYSVTPLTWKLPKPMYLAPDELVVIRLFNAPGNSNTGSRTVNVAVAGRSLPRTFARPAVISYPWVASYIPPYLATGVNQVDSSAEHNLVNPFQEVLRVQRFIGRYDPTRVGGQSNEVNGATEQDTLVRAVDSFGNILVRDPTPFFHLFQAPTRSWTVNADLAPNGFYIFTVERNWATFGWVGSVAISMVGYHDVPQR